ncbi:MAG: cyclic nucleotide-binding domain-containing protein [Pseudomonadota bacterium]
MEDILQKRIDEGALRRVDVNDATPQRVIDLLVDNPMFAEFDTKELQAIAPYFMIFEAPAGRAIIREGEPGQFLCIVVEGKLSVLKGNDGGKRRKITVLRRGRSLGEMSLIDGLPNSASAETDEDSVLLLLTRNNLFRITQDYPKIGVKWLWQLARLVSQRLRQTTGVLLDYID